MGPRQIRPTRETFKPKHAGNISQSYKAVNRGATKAIICLPCTHRLPCPKPSDTRKHSFPRSRHVSIGASCEGQASVVRALCEALPQGLLQREFSGVDGRRRRFSGGFEWQGRGTIGTVGFRAPSDSRTTKLECQWVGHYNLPRLYVGWALWSSAQQPT